MVTRGWQAKASWAAWSPPRRDRHRVLLPEIHRRICDWLRWQAVQGLLSEFMTVQERSCPLSVAQKTVQITERCADNFTHDPAIE